MKIQYRKSDLNIIDSGNEMLLTAKHDNLQGCEVVINTIENIQLEFMIEGKKIDDINLKQFEKIQFLYKLTILVQTKLKNLIFTISPQNLYLTDYGQIKVCERKLCDKSQADREKQIVKEIIALAGYLIDNKDYSELLEVNSEQLVGSKNLINITNNKTIDDLVLYFKELLTREEEKFRNHQMLIGKKKFKRLTGNKLQYQLAIIISLFVILFISLYVIPFKNQQITLYDSYISGESTNVIETINDMKIGRMSKTEKLIAAKVVINDQVQLTAEQKTNIINQLDEKTNEDIFDYWLFIGRSEYEEAYNRSIALSDADMQIYALLMLINEAQNDESLDSEKRKELISNYESQVEELSKKKTELQNEKMSEASNGEANE